MVLEGNESFDYDRLTAARLRLLRELADDRTEREAAESLGITYSGVRSIVEDIKNKTGLHSVREIARWWRANRGDWLVWAAEQGGASKEGYGR